ncbi:putative dehydrogenase [Arthrobacter silviterrae]|uniref:Gfo/Idh/MocA family oxidoreductase n=2 Tax=Arthrobacter silviterrae TaxID=2026658 RepID=A0ABX0D5M7_9MICC|nr:Gfo/Idh/MocA family oxidoreductase [Arthrobacter silviterrae]MDQ0278559.1 putative dehydrogenase [Arthrobacter silviterrae]NGN82184.1 Gfo/Idh/MocA family oxidoreductase [Arthrobacter silviterrae]
MKQMHSQAPSLRVALIGHSFMGTIHAQAWQSAPRFFELGLKPEVAVVCGRNDDAASVFATKFDIPQVENDWRKVVADPSVDVVDICTPGHLHSPIALAALAAGKHVLCEKPLSNSLGEAEEMTAAAEAAQERGIQSMVGYSYRRTPALAHARQLVSEGKIGRIFHIRAVYLQDWIVDEEFPLVWRLQREHAGSGALGDIGAHVVDLAQYLTGHHITGVSALTETFVKTRPLVASSDGLSATASDERGSVTVDDAAVFIARTDKGALATFEASRFATGRKNALRIEINGARGSLAFDFESMNELWVQDNTGSRASSGFSRILVTEPEHPYMDAWWPAGHGLGYEHTFVHEIADFVRNIAAGTQPSPSFRDGLAIQRVLAAVEASAQANAVWTATNYEF